MGAGPVHITYADDSVTIDANSGTISHGSPPAIPEWFDSQTVPVSAGPAGATAIAYKVARMATPVRAHEAAPAAPDPAPSSSSSS
eukprot:13908878-Heterocapsa_arctica.AAC.1